MTPATSLRIDGHRLWSTIERSSAIGIGRPGGLRRLPGTDADRVMRDQFVAWCRDIGCGITVDGVGNVFARREGREPDIEPVLIGSHLDTQVAGGRFDGILGVLAGVEVLRTLADHDIRTRRPIEVVSWCNEEGARFQPPMMASGAFAGVYPPDVVLDAVDGDGTRLGDELARIGYLGDAPVGGRTLDAYFELHIEQGAELDRSSVDVGIVNGSYTVHGMKVKARGATAHSGPTPMAQRRNALVGVARLAVEVDDIGWRHASSGGRATVARITGWPNTTGILTEVAELSLDVRHAEPDIADRMLAEVEGAMARCAERSNVEMEVVARYRFGDEVFDGDCAELLRQAGRDLGIRTVDMPSIAGHDAYHLSKVAPTAMVFTPCVDGISHNEAELAVQARSVPGVDVLLRAVVARADRVDP